MTRIILLAGIIGCFYMSMAHAADSRPIRLEDVDTDGDNRMSPAERENFLRKLGQEKYLETQQIRQVPVATPVPQINPLPKNPTAAAQKSKPVPRANIKNPYGEKGDENKKLPVFLQKKEGMRVDEMKMLDSNQDGILQQSELNRGAAAKFSTADTNRDGILSQQEMDASLNRIKKEKGEYGTSFGGEYANRAKNRYKNADSNKDGKLSQKEYEAFSKQYQQNFDRNGDGIISKEEFRGEGEKLPSSYFKKPKE